MPNFRIVQIVVNNSTLQNDMKKKDAEMEMEMEMESDDEETKKGNRERERVCERETG